MKQDATLPVGSNQINDLPVTISSNNYYDLITTFDIDIAVSKAAFVDYQVLIDGSDQLMIQTDYLTTEFLLELDGTLPAYLLTNPARHDGNLPSGTNLFYEITESSDPTRISIVGSGLNTRIKILPGFLHTDDISFKVKCTLSNSNYVDKTTSLTTFILKIYPPGGI
jgi:hypothetical protein